MEKAKEKFAGIKTFLRLYFCPLWEKLSSVKIAAASLALFVLLFWIEGYDFAILQPQDNWLEAADNLIFPLKPADTMVFPFQYLFQSAVFIHLKALKPFFLLMPVILAFLAGSRHSAPAGFMGAAFSFILLQQEYSSYRSLEQIAITSCALICLSVSMGFKEKPFLRMSVFSLGLAALSWTKGICFPAVLMFAVHEAFCLRRGKKNAFAAIYLLVPFLIAGIVWGAVSSSGNGLKISFTETGDRLLPNLMAGAMGFVGTTEGDVRAAWNNSGVAKAFLIAAQTIMSHPLDWLKGIYGRLAFLVNNSFAVLPLLAGFAASFIMFFRRPRMLIMPLAAGYFFCVYIIMPVEARYFVPAWFLMCVCSAAVLSEIGSKIAAWAGAKPAAAESQPLLSGKLSYVFLFAGASPVLLLWLASLVLAATFNFRRANFDIDKAFAKFPDNVYLLQSPLRSSYPSFWDYGARLELSEKTEKGLNKYFEFKRRYLEFFSPGRQTARINALPEKKYDKWNIPRINGAVAWQDIMLMSFKNLKKGDRENYSVLSDAAALSCMLSTGFVRKDEKKGRIYTPEEKKYADSLAMAAAVTCADEIGELFFAIPPKEENLKRMLAANGFLNYFSKDWLLSLYEQRNAESCQQCCVPGGFLAVPSACGLGYSKLIALHGHLDGYSDAANVWCNGIIFPTDEKEKGMLIKLCKEINGKITSYDMELAAKNPEMRQSLTYSSSIKAAYTLRSIYEKSGDFSNAYKMNGILIDSTGEKK